MGFFDAIMGLFGGGGRTVHYGNVNADDIESYWQVDHELDQAERAGPDALQAALAKWGLESMDHWDQVKAALYALYGKMPDFTMAAGRVQYRAQMADMADSYVMPDEYASPVHGIDLNRYAAIKGRLQLGHQPEEVLNAHHLDAARWSEVDQAWSSRMGPQADAFACQILRGSYHAMLQQALAAYGRR